MQNQIADSLGRVVSSLYEKGVLANAEEETANSIIEVRTTPPNIQGDYSTNLVLKHIKHSNLSAEELAAIVIRQIEQEPWCEKAEFVRPGFINLYCNNSNCVVGQIMKQGAKFGSDIVGTSATKTQTKQNILIEYVSANPTGPLHTGHGRAAALGSCLANILRFIGHKVDTEFYVNDAGRQMDILTSSLFWRMLQIKGVMKTKKVDSIPSNMYQGKYVNNIATDWLNTDEGQRYWKDISSNTDIIKQEIDKIIQQDSPDNDDEEKLDNIIITLKRELADNFTQLRETVLAKMMDEMKQDLQEFGVQFNSWYHESSSAKDDKDLEMLDILTNKDYAYEKDGALWFRGTQFGDDKDRVLRRKNENLTYFGSDIYYHHNKYQRGYDVIMDILGADHHGYLQRVGSSMAALGNDPTKLKFLLLQLVFLVRGGSRDSMSTRAGKFTSLKELVQYLGEGADQPGRTVTEVGRDAARLFFLMYKNDRTINFDLELARKKSKDNPVYYVQYAYARICRIFEELAKQGGDWDKLRKQGIKSLDMLDDPHEKALMLKLNQFIPTLASIGTNYEVHLLANYLRELASDFHSYYNAVRILGEDLQSRDSKGITNPRLCLCEATGIIIKSGLSLMGLAAPNKM